jgi:hypothetical protein
MPTARQIIVLEEVVPRILSIRGHNIILDMDLARLYETTTKALKPSSATPQDSPPSSCFA